MMRPSNLIAGAGILLLLAAGVCAQDDVADVPSEKLRGGNDPNKTYFLIHSADAAKDTKTAFSLLLVLPGGDGSESFHPFVKRIFKSALSPDYLVAQLVSVKWSPNQVAVWPTAMDRCPKARFSTEQFIEEVIQDVQKNHPVNPERIFTLSWSSSGPAAYAASLQDKTAITGSYIAMSVFKPEYLPSMKHAKGRRYYIEHSPEDKTCPFRMAQQAEKSLQKAGATVRLSTYSGGHGWVGDAFGRIQAGIHWLEGKE